MMNPELRCVVSVSGMRGIVGDTMDPAVIQAVAACYGTTIAKGGTVILGQDGRPTGDMLMQAAAAALRGVGCNVIELGIVPTPTVPIMIRHLKAAGGIQLSASHNPVEWNALKLFARSGRNIDGKDLARLLKAYAAGTPCWQRWDQCGSYRRDDTALDVHLAKVLAGVDVERVRAAGFTVLLDSVNGAGSVIGPRLLEALGCRVVPLYDRQDRLFPRDPEPTAEKVRETGAVVKAVGAAIGFVQDPDADRLAIIDENGRYIGEEYTLALAAGARLAAAREQGVKKPVAVTNLSTSRMIDDIAAQIGGTVVRSAVGEANVVDAMLAHKAVIGGEGNGGVIDPGVVMGRDSQAGMALLLEFVARSGKSLSQLVATLPSYAIHKEKVDIDRAAVAAAHGSLRDQLSGAVVDERDGIKFSWDRSWVHLRASGTEPVSRIIAEAPTAKEARALAAQVRKAVGARVIA
ncbi:MAG: phosphoglucosamine mutase [Planctomycetota bacterium]|jgi:phosphomannomutase|nr:phosphoglucosamine mutase [Planctomycetota bacterium]